MIEIKFSSQPEPSDFRKLDKIARLVNASRRVLVCRIRDDENAISKDQWLVNLPGYFQALGVEIPS